ncbi:hypothetical protein QS257_08890 [Terrilactibacillus sp. S3-3]|nr:hypothetical protein QS257_08890 [Terrilactibacillus sp. S3-3]
MKKAVLYTILFLVLWTSYADLTTGVLPSGTKPKSQTTVSSNTAVQYKMITVSPSETLLSIVERLNSHVPSVEQVTKDFESLNPHVSPDNIQIGKTYAFPVYGK